MKQRGDSRGQLLTRCVRYLGQTRAAAPRLRHYPCAWTLQRASGPETNRATDNPRNPSVVLLDISSRFLILAYKQIDDHSDYITQQTEQSPGHGSLVSFQGIQGHPRGDSEPE